MEHSDWKDILVVIEMEENAVTELSLELIGIANELAQYTCSEVKAVIIEKIERQDISELEKLPLKEIFLYEMEMEFQVEIVERYLIHCIDTAMPNIVLIGGTSKGQALASRVAVHYKSGVTADCTGLDINKEGILVQTRPAFGGDVIADIITPNTVPQFATVRKGVFEKLKYDMGRKCKCTEVKTKNIVNNDIISKYKVLGKKRTENFNLLDTKVLVVAGAGLKKKEDVELLEKLARLLDGELGCSRAIVEKGWMDSQRQIGLSGKSVSSEILITCGVSGSIQFQSGIRKVKCIIAINQDEEAPIFRTAHHAICGDLYKIIPDLIKKLES